ncbi:cell division ATP-binding protein FtsE [Brachybacterium phenoliresistens]|uniref:Cell division ATP-binding protein FtsE n=1 Tax=Brachybacterium phenoliresistens TaxID=396014 RepID=Z9JSP6_9MICO|nr:cell division protein FtsE [Brachybacterium phenoliresistens]
MIRFDNVTKTYQRGQKPAVENLTLEFARGEFVFLVGASGSGKSTLMRLVLKETSPTRGNVYVAGKDIARIPSWRVPTLRRDIGMVFQDFRLLPSKTAYQNIEFALAVIGTPRKVVRRLVPEMLEMVGLADKGRRLPHELSGGEQQRVAIARAYVNRPSILLADEPTGNLDPATAEGILDLLGQINDRGTTVVMATHDATAVDRMRKRVVEMVGGHVVRDEEAGGYESASEASVISGNLPDGALPAELAAGDGPEAAPEPREEGPVVLATGPASAPEAPAPEPATTPSPEETQAPEEKPRRPERRRRGRRAAQLLEPETADVPVPADAPTAPAAAATPDAPAAPGPAPSADAPASDAPHEPSAPATGRAARTSRGAAAGRRFRSRDPFAPGAAAATLAAAEGPGAAAGPAEYAGDPASAAGGSLPSDGEDRARPTAASVLAASPWLEDAEDPRAEIAAELPAEAEEPAVVDDVLDEDLYDERDTVLDEDAAAFQEIQDDPEVLR